jgi:hypothetical protein
MEALKMLLLLYQAVITVSIRNGRNTSIYMMLGIMRKLWTFDSLLSTATASRRTYMWLSSRRRV